MPIRQLRQQAITKRTKKHYANPEARRHYLRRRVIEVGSYQAVADEEGLSTEAVRQYAGGGLTSR